MQNSFTMTTSDGCLLFIHKWATSSSTNRVAFLIHGFGEHAGRYQHFPKFLSETFQHYYAFDLRGHGRSGGLRGDTPNFDRMLEDIKEVLDEIKKQEDSSKELHLIAHSFGGLLALLLLLKEKALPFKTATISSPLLKIALHIPKFKKILGELLARTLPKTQLPNDINPSFLSHDPAIVEAYVKDRLVQRKMTPRTYVDLCRSMEWVVSQNGPLAIPTLFLIPGEDKIVDTSQTLKFYQNIKDQKKDIRQYPGFYHEIFNEVGKEKVFADLKQWVLQYSSG